jgi:hypothetical protein
MPYDYGAINRIPVDPRVIERIQRSPQMMYEQGSSFMEDWGGPGMYQLFASLPANQRLTYAAVLDGHVNSLEISTVTGLTPEKVDSALTQLEKAGLVTIQTETPL